MAISVFDNVLTLDKQADLYAFLNAPTWAFGWKSEARTDMFSFWHKHFAGNARPDHLDQGGLEKPYECASELSRSAPLVHEQWLRVSRLVKEKHVLVRCYANGMPYGSDGSVHTDSVTDRSLTLVYYPHPNWHPNWGGETVLFNGNHTDIVASIYAKPNRLVVFPGTIPHAARGVSRACPVMRITLVFKIELVESDVAQ